MRKVLTCFHFILNLNLILERIYFLSHVSKNDMARDEKYMLYQFPYGVQITIDNSNAMKKKLCKMQLMFKNNIWTNIKLVRKG